MQARYQTKAGQYKLFGQALSVIAIIGSTGLYLMGHDSAGLMNAVQVVFLYYLGSNPPTIDMQAWGSSAHSAAFALSAADRLADRWIIPMALYFVGFLLGAVFKMTGLAHFAFDMTPFGSEFMPAVHPRRLKGYSPRVALRLLALRAVQFAMQVARFPLIVYCLMSFTGNNTEMKSLAIILMLFFLSVSAYIIISDVLFNDESARIKECIDTQEESRRVKVLRMFVKIMREKDILLQLGIAAALVLQHSAAVLVVVPVAFVLRNMVEMVSTNRRISWPHLLILGRCALQTAFLVFVLFTRDVPIAFILGIALIGYSWLEAVAVQFLDCKEDPTRVSE